MHFWSEEKPVLMQAGALGQLLSDAKRANEEVHRTPKVALGLCVAREKKHLAPRGFFERQPHLL
jgi:hypothetical protein